MSGISPSYFPTHLNMAIFWPFFTIQRQGIEQTTNLLFILKVLRCSNNLMQKLWPEILTLKKDLDKPTVGLVHLQLFRPSVIRIQSPCLNPTSLVTRVQCWFLFDLQSKFLWFCAIEEVHFSAWTVGIRMSTLKLLMNWKLVWKRIKS